MVIPVAWIKTILLAALLLWVWWLYQLWQPARQAELHTRHLLQHASSRDWTEVGRMMAGDYRDAWGHDRAQALQAAEEVGHHFFTLQMGLLEPVTIRAEGSLMSVSAMLGIYGSGTPVAHAIMDEVREAKGPFVFRWRRSGGWPWQWELAEAGHADLAARFPR